MQGLTVSNATYAKPIFTTASGNTLVINGQVAVARTGAPGDKLDAGLCSFDDTAFNVDADGYVTLAGGSGPAVDTNTGDDGVAVSADGSGNFNWNGITVANATHAKPAYFKDATAANTIDLDIQVGAAITGAPGDKNDAGLSSYDDTYFTVDANGYVSQTQAGIDTATANFIVDPAGTKAEYTTIQSAINAASAGDIIFIKEGSYSEDLTIDKNLTLCAFDVQDRNIESKVILQSSTVSTDLFTLSGTATLKLVGLEVRTNTSAGIIDVNVTTSVALEQCRLTHSNGGVTAFTVSAASVNLSIVACTFISSGTTTAKMLDMSGSGSVTWVTNCMWQELNGTTTPSTISAGTLEMRGNLFTGQTVFNTSGTGIIACSDSNFGRLGNVGTFTFITTSGTGTGNFFERCYFGSGSATAISVGVNTTVNCYDCTFNSSATNVIDGAGTFKYGGLVFSGTSSHINATTQTVVNEGPSRTIASTNPGGNNTLYINNTDNTNTSSNSRLRLGSQASGGDPFISWEIGGAQSFSFGIDNSDSDVMKLTNNGAGPSAGTTLLEMTTGQSSTFASSNVGNTNELKLQNTDNTDTGSHALVTVTSGGGSGGSASYRACIGGGGCYHWGIDNADDKLKVSTGDTYLSGNILLTMDTVGNSLFGFATAGNTIDVTVENADNTNTSSHSSLTLQAGGTSGGDPFIRWNIPSGQDYSMGIDNSDSDKLTITDDANPSTGNALWEMTSAGERTMPLQPAFLATHTVAQDNVTGNNTNVTVNFTTEIFDQNSDYDGTNTYTAPVTGRHEFHVSIYATSVASGTTFNVHFVTSNRNLYICSLSADAIKNNSGAVLINGSCICDMDASDTCKINLLINGIGADTADIPAGGTLCWFGGKLAC